MNQSAPPHLTVTRRKDAVLLQVHLQPGASRNQVVGTRSGVLRVRVTSPPLENRANRQLMEFLAELLGLPKSSVELVSGSRTRLKTVAIKGLTAPRLLELMTPYLVE